MEDKKKYGIIAMILLAIVIGILLFYPKNKSPEENEPNSRENIIPESKTENLQEQKVSGYHLVTYKQSANTNSFIQSLTVTASNQDQIRFVIGTIDDHSVIQERTSFELPCQKGENTFDLLKERHLLKTGEYLFMDIEGQDLLFTQKGSQTKSLVQNENNKVSGKMLVTESNYILPFHYELQTVQTYQALFIGNDITTQNGGKGLHATDETLDYYALTQKRLENTFPEVKTNRLNASAWETFEGEETKKQWITEHLPKETITDLDLVIFQLGDQYNGSNFENDMTYLVQTIRQNSPNAEILWLGLWNKNDQVLNTLPVICERLQIAFIDIHDLNVPEYQSLVTEPEVYYPNNEAMQVISNRIIDVLNYQHE